MLVIKEYSKVDNDGFWLDTIRLKYDDESIPNPAPQGYFEANRPEGFIRPKWDNDSWVEGATQEENKISDEDINAIAIMELATKVYEGGV